MLCSLLGSLSHFRTHNSEATVQQSQVCVPLRKFLCSFLSQGSASVRCSKAATSTHNRVCKGNEH